MSRSHERRAGMTLIELVVALTVTAMLFAAGSSAVGLVLDQRDAATGALDETLDAATGRATLTHWAAAIRMPEGSSRPILNGVDGTYESLPDDEVTFLTSAPTPMGESVALVRLFIDRDETTPETGLVADISEWMGTRRTRVTLAPQAEGLEVRYRSRLLSGRVWHSAWTSSTVLPAGIELRVIGGEANPLQPLWSLPIRVPIRGGR